MNIFHTPITPSSWSANEEATGYEASNLGTPRVRKPWRSTTLGSVTVTATFSAPTNVYAILAQHCNFSGCNVYWVDASGSPTSTLGGGFVLQQDDFGIHRVGQKASELPGIGAYTPVTSMQIQIPAGGTTDGASYREIGAVHFFGALATLDRGIRPGLRVENREAGETKELANGVDILTSSGPRKHVIDATQLGLRNENLGELARRARAGVIGADLVGANAGLMPWENKSLTFSSVVQPRHRETSFNLVEVA